MRAHLHPGVWLAVLCLTASASAWAQTTAARCADQASSCGAKKPITIRSNRVSERVEYIRVEDAGNRVDEVRVGGQTKSITVQPKANVPAYDVQPASPTRPVLSESGPGSAGQRTWKVFSFY